MTAKNPTGVLVVLVLASVSFAMSQTLVIPALPAIGASVGAGAAATSWLLTGFLLSASISTPIVGKLGDVYGKGRMLTIVLLVFSAGAVICATAGSIEQLIGGRVIQGVAGGIFPLAFGIVRDTFPRERAAGGLGLVSAMFGIGGGIGLPLSGILTDHADTSWLFWIVLLALPAALAAHRLVPPSATVERTRIDWFGAALLSGALLALLLGVTEANDWGWTSPGTLALLGAGVVLAVVWVRVEQRQPEPLIDLRLLRERAVAATNLAAVLVGFSMFSSFLLIPQFAQVDPENGYGFGYTVTRAGLLLLPAAVAQLLAGALAGRLAVRIGFRLTFALGATLSTLSFLVLVLEHGHAWWFLISGALLGAGITLSLAAMANIIVGAVPQADVGIATGINTVMRTVGGAFGAAVATAILTADTIGSSPIPTEAAYTAAFALSAGGGLLAILATLLVPAATEGAGRHQTGELGTAPAARAAS